MPAAKLRQRSPGNDRRGGVTRHVRSPPRSSARTTALRLLSRRDYTTTELRDRLRARGHDEAEADEVVRGLTADGTLDDRRVAAAHVRTAARVKGRGRLRIARELEARGVERDLVRDLVRDVSADDEAAGIERVLVRKRVPAMLSADERRKIFAHLLRRGFPADAITSALRKRG